MMTHSALPNSVSPLRGVSLLALALAVQAGGFAPDLRAGDSCFPDLPTGFVYSITAEDTNKTEGPDAFTFTVSRIPVFGPDPRFLPLADPPAFAALPGSEVNYLIIAPGGVGFADGDDFDHDPTLAGTVFFGEGETEVTLEIFVEEDFIVERDETFTVALAPDGACGCPCGCPGAGAMEANGTIENGDTTVISVGGDGGFPQGLAEAEGEGGGAQPFFFDVGLGFHQEGDSGDSTEVIVPVTLSRPVDGELTVVVGLAGGEGPVPLANEDDFDVFTAEAVIVPLETSGEALLVISGDDAHELDETFFVEILEIMIPPGFDLGDFEVDELPAEGVIFDDDPIRVTISDAQRAEGDGGEFDFEPIGLLGEGETHFMRFTITLETDSFESVSFIVSTVPGTARGVVVEGDDPEGDYINTLEFIEFDGFAGEQRQVLVPLLGDRAVEFDETFTLEGEAFIFVADPIIFPGPIPGGDILFENGTGTIFNDDVATLSIGDVSMEEGTGGGTTVFSFTVELDNEVRGGGFAVPFAPVFAEGADNPATPGEDFDSTGAGFVEFLGEAGETRTAEVEVVADSNLEPDELFDVLLGPPLSEGLVNVGAISVPGPEEIGSTLLEETFSEAFFFFFGFFGGGDGEGFAPKTIRAIGDDLVLIGDLVVDVSDPTEPQVITALPPLGFGGGLPIEDPLPGGDEFQRRFVTAAEPVGDGFVFLGVADSGIELWDFENPEFPLLIGVFEIPFVTGLAVDGPIVYALDSEGLLAIDFSNAGDPDFIDGVPFDFPIGGEGGGEGFPIGGLDIVVEDGRAYVALGLNPFFLFGARAIIAIPDLEELLEGGLGGLAVFDVDGSGISTLGFLSLERSSADLAVDDGIVYLADGGLTVVDATDPEEPFVLGGFEDDALLNAIRLIPEEGLAVAAAFADGVRVVDISDPGAPTKVAQITGLLTEMGQRIDPGAFSDEIEDEIELLFLFAFLLSSPGIEVDGDLAYYTDLEQPFLDIGLEGEPETLINFAVADLFPVALGEGEILNDDFDVGPRADLEVVVRESHDPLIAGGDLLISTVTVTNKPGSIPATDVVLDIEVILPEGVDVLFAVASAGQYNAGVGRWAIPSLRPGKSEQLTIGIRAAPWAPPSETLEVPRGEGITATLLGVLGNGDDLNGPVFVSARVFSAGVPLENTGDDADDETTPVDREVNLVVTGRESIDPVIAGSGDGNLRHAVRVVNRGPSNASGVVIGAEIDLPPGVSLDGGDTLEGTFDQGSSTWTVGDLDRGSRAELMLTFTADPTAGNPGGLPVTGGYGVTDSNEERIMPGDDGVTLVTTVARQIDLKVALARSSDVVTADGGTLTYTVTVTNAGPSNSNAVMLTANLDLPAGVDAGDPTPVFTSGTSWGIGPLARGASATFTLPVTVGSTTTDLSTIGASFTAALGDPVALPPVVDGIVGCSPPEELINTGDDTASLDTPVFGPVQLELTTEGPDGPAIAGLNNVVYKVRCLNHTLVSARNVRVGVTLTLPAGATLRSVAPSGGTFTRTPGTTNGTWLIPSCESGSSGPQLVVTVRIPATVADESTVAISSAITAVDQEFTIIGDDPSEASTTIRRGVDLRVRHRVLPRSRVVAGGGLENLRFVAEVANVGHLDATGVVLTETLTLPATGVIVHRTIPRRGTGPVVTLNVGDLPAGTARSVTVVMTVTADADPGTGAIRGDATVAADQYLYNTGDDAAGSAVGIVPTREPAYNEWLLEHFTLAELSDPNLKRTLWGPNADADGDGSVNICEFAFNSDPRDDDSFPECIITVEGGTPKLTFIRRIDRLRLMYVGEARGNDGWLTGADNLVEAPPVVPDTAPEGFETVTLCLVRAVRTDGGPQIIRVRIVFETPPDPVIP